MAYQLEGTLIEVCDCNVICPCWVGQDPDNETCHGGMAWHFEKGDIDGVDVSGLTFALAAQIPGNVLQGNWRAVAFVDDKATDAQHDAIVAVFTGKKGGPVADLCGLIGEVVGLEKVPIECRAEKGSMRLKVGDVLHAEVEPLQGATGQPTAMMDTIFSSVPGAPAYASKSKTYRFDSEALGVRFDTSGRSAVHTQFRYAG